MKKILTLLAIICFNSSFASYVGSPLAPETINYGFFISPTSSINTRVGYIGDYISDARFKKSDVGGSKIDNFKVDLNVGELTINFQNRLDLFGGIGAARVRSDWRFVNGAAVSRIELESNFRFAYTFGGQAVLFQWGNLGLAAGGKYVYTKPTLAYITLDGSPRDANHAKSLYKEWQINMGLAYAVDIFTPYIGAKYLRGKSNIQTLTFAIADGNNTFMNMKNRDRFGVYLGCSLSNKKYFILTIEARFIDEEAISVAGEIKF